VRKKRFTTGHMLSEADVAAQYPPSEYPGGATKVDGSLEARKVPETPAEFKAASTDAFQRGSPEGSTSD